MPMSLTKRLAVLLKGMISNISEIQAELSLYGCPHSIYKRDDIILYLLEHYLETDKMSPIGAMQKLMKRLKGHFVLMALIAEGEWLMVGCRDEPLIIGEGSQTVYFGTNFEAMVHFSPSSIPVVNKKTVLFCMTPDQSEPLTPIIIN
jgi:glucosamine 6-phosphate synthetase-like amidotransferase/phosphosugar isomerase protein